MKKAFYIVFILFISIAHTIVLDIWLTDKDFSHKTSELTIERKENTVIADSISLSHPKKLIKSLIDTKSGDVVKGQNN